MIIDYFGVGGRDGGGDGYWETTPLYLLVWGHKRYIAVPKMELCWGSWL